VTRLGGPPLKKKGFFQRAETTYSMTENLGGLAEDTSATSHSEGFVTMIRLHGARLPPTIRSPRGSDEASAALVVSDAAQTSA
jgi:hypothetical protein